jgi:hypothetical protein
VYVDTLVVIWYCRVGILRTLGYLSFDDFRTSFRIIESWHCGATEPMPPYISVDKAIRPAFQEQQENSLHVQVPCGGRNQKNQIPFPFVSLKESCEEFNGSSSFLFSFSCFLYFVPQE